MPKKQYTFDAKVWLYPGKAGWCFVTLPKKLAQELDFSYAEHKRGWGSLKVAVAVGASSWETSIFPDKEAESYVLPLKKQIRQAEKINLGDVIAVSLKIIV